MRHFWLGLLSFPMLLALPPTVRALTIDNFEEGAFSLSDDVVGSGGPGLVQQTGLSPSNVIGGSRTVFGNFQTATGGLITFDLDPTPGEITCTLNAFVEIGSCNVGYPYNYFSGGDLNVDLTVGGDMFKFEVTALAGGIELTVDITDSASGTRVSPSIPGGSKC